MSPNNASRNVLNGSVKEVLKEWKWLKKEFKGPLRIPQKGKPD